MDVRIFHGQNRVAQIDPGDRGLAYGDGLFETMRVHRGGIPWLDAHLRRLRHGADRLGILLPDDTLLRVEIASACANQDSAVLKLIVTRGTGGRGYAPPDPAQPMWLLSLHAAPLPMQDVSVVWCGTTLAEQPALAGLKHCNRLEQVLARREVVAAGADEGLMHAATGHVISATAANLFIHDGGDGWLTPPLDRCGVAGVCRDWLLHHAPARETPLDRPAVLRSSAIFLCNAVRGILPVRRLDAREWPESAHLRALQRQLAAAHPGLN
ncbi:aminodeoxychorismate lyase [Solilutibacter silvestris]|uniref:Aminodeoxychorismate lyase n=1 Tax=Solilutibacter silvestris TaxID=1645665 RepID=A0A2K1PZQ7_9GAMM|nr:aminodeoxychorismate lyase [Lysobacter silvestris]PNS08262.1 aminodeoxychorismate lyase [Lysobacter silvestris]